MSARPACPRSHDWQGHPHVAGWAELCRPLCLSSHPQASWQPLSPRRWSLWEHRKQAEGSRAFQWDRGRVPSHLPSNGPCGGSGLPLFLPAGHPRQSSSSSHQPGGRVTNTHLGEKRPAPQPSCPRLTARPRCLSQGLCWKAPGWGRAGWRKPSEDGVGGVPC